MEWHVILCYSRISNNSEDGEVIGFSGRPTLTFLVFFIALPGCEKMLLSQNRADFMLFDSFVFVIRRSLVGSQQKRVYFDLALKGKKLLFRTSPSEFVESQGGKV